MGEGVAGARPVEREDIDMLTVAFDAQTRVGDVGGVGRSGRRSVSGHQPATCESKNAITRCQDCAEDGPSNCWR